MTPIQSVTVTSEAAADVANQIHRLFGQLTGAIFAIQTTSEATLTRHASGQRDDGSWITNAAKDLPIIEAKMDVLFQLWHAVGLTQEQLQSAYSSDNVWFTCSK